MVLLIYSVTFVVAFLCSAFVFSSGFKGVVFEEGVEKVVERVWIGSLILYSGLSIFTLVYGIITTKVHLIVVSSPTIIYGFWLAFYIFGDGIMEVSDELFLVVSTVLLGLWFSINVCTIAVGFVNVETLSKEEFVKTIDIVSYENTQYADVSIGRFYIKSDSTYSYYYEKESNDGGIVTRCISGVKDYVVRYEDDEYENNAHIKVSEVYANNWYGFEIPIRNNYYIYIPKDSVLYA